MDRTTKHDEPHPKHHRHADPPRWVGLVKFLLLAMVVASFFWLAQSMVQHHFFTGGALNNPQAAVGP